MVLLQAKPYEPNPKFQFQGMFQPGCTESVDEFTDHTVKLYPKRIVQEKPQAETIRLGEDEFLKHRGGYG